MNWFGTPDIKMIDEDIYIKKDDIEERIDFYRSYHMNGYDDEKTKNRIPYEVWKEFNPYNDGDLAELYPWNSWLFDYCFADIINQDD